MLSWFISRRLGLASDTKNVSPAIYIATIAVALSLAVMIVAIAVVLGFKDEITRRVSGFNSDITLSAWSGGGEDDPIVSLTPTLRQVIEEMPWVEDVALQTTAPVIFKTSDDFKGVYLKSLTGKNLKEFVGESLVSGALPDYESLSSLHGEAADSVASSVVLSAKTALELRLKPGDNIPTYFLTDNLRVRNLRVAAVFDSHFEDYDDNFAFVALPLVQELAGLSPSQGTIISVAVDDFSNIEEYSADLQHHIVDGLQQGRIYKMLEVRNARGAGAAYFNWLDMLDMNVWVVLLLMTAVACVTLVSGLLVIMVSKVRFIALMAALGSRRGLLRRIFMLLAMRVALLGMAIGNILGIGIVLWQKHTHLIPLDPDSYYMDFVPMETPWLLFGLLNVAVLIVVWIILILPSRFVGSVSPAKVLARE